MQFQWFRPNPCGDKEGSYTQASDTLHFKWMALWLKAASTRAPSVLELQGRSLCLRWDCNQGFQSSRAFHTLKESLGTDPWRTPRSGKVHAEGKRVSVLDRDQWWHLRDCGKVWNLPVNSRASKPVGNISEVPPHPWHTLGTDLFYWNRLNFLVVGDYFTKFLIVRKLPNSSTQAVIKELGMIFTEFGWPFVLRSENEPCYSSREFQQFLEFYQIHHTTTSPHHLQSNGFAEALVGILKKLMEKSIKDGKPWNYGLLKYWVTPISSTIPSPLEALTGRKPRTSFPQIPLTIGKSVKSSRIWQELIKCQPSTSTSYSMELKPGQPVFIKEVHGNVQKTGVIDLPAKEPDSYWIKFPDSSILRRTHQMIKPRSLPSHFKLETQSKEWNNSQFIPSSASRNFQTMLPGPEQPVLQTGNLVTPAFHEQGISTERQNIATSSSGVTQPSISVVRSSHSTKGDSLHPGLKLFYVVELSETQWKVFHF